MLVSASKSKVGIADKARQLNSMLYLLPTRNRRFLNVTPSNALRVKAMSNLTSSYPVRQVELRALHSSSYLLYLFPVYRIIMMAGLNVMADR